MCQQTRVEVVKLYWVRWMKQLPSIKSLAQADPDTIRQLWAGLGYYRRAALLQAGAKYVETQHDGTLPSSLPALLAIPGIGRYTAGAISSIVFDTPTPVVDGNVTRVISRLRGVNATPADRKGQQLMWQLAEDLLARESPRDWNQAMMELGAMVCTPKSPKCEACPVSDFCKALAESKQKKRVCTLSSDNNSSPEKIEELLTDIEELVPDSKSSSASSTAAPSSSSSSSSSCSSPDFTCLICSPFPASHPYPSSVMDYPPRAVKKPPLEQHFAVCVVKRKCINSGEELYLLFRRPPHGLLAGQLEFPSALVEKASSPITHLERLIAFLATQFNISVDNTRKRFNLPQNATTLPSLGEVSHLFSHRLHLMHAYQATIEIAEDEQIARGRKIESDVKMELEEKNGEKEAKKKSIAKKRKLNNGTSKTDKDSKSVQSNYINLVDEEEEEEAENDQAEPEDDDDADNDETSDKTFLLPRSFDWVSLSSLTASHLSSKGNALGLTTGQRKIIALFNQQGGKKSNKVSGTPAKSKPSTSLTGHKYAVESTSHSTIFSPTKKTKRNYHEQHKIETREQEGIL